MLMLLPLLAFAVLVINLLGRGGDVDGARPWQGSFLLASALWGAMHVVLTEGLSLFSAIGRPGVTLGWVAVLMAAVAWGWSKGQLQAGWCRLVSLISGLEKFEFLLLSLIGAMAITLMAVVFAAPVNTVDVLQYHMPRVLQWAQNGSLEHFPSPNIGQNSRPYWAEGVMLHLKLLWGDDAPVELVSWFAWLFIAVPASGILQLLGGGRRLAWLAAVMVWTIPTALLHATTGMVDNPSAYWAGALGFFVVAQVKGRRDRYTVLGIGLALALGMLTKGPFFPFAAGLMILWGISLLHERNWHRLLETAVACLLIVVGLNAGFWIRNIKDYGGPYGNSVPVAVVGDLLSEREPFPPESFEPRTNYGPLVALEARAQKLMRMSLTNFITPFNASNRVMLDLMDKHPRKFPDPYVDALRVAAWNSVMTGGNPAHWIMAWVGLVLASIIAPAPGLDANRRTVVGYALAVIVGYLLLSLLTFAASVYGVRYQLPFLVLAMPLMAFFVGRVERGSWPIILFLLLYGIPYVLISQTRPVIGLTPWPTKVESVFVEEDRTILFAASPEIEDEYRIVAQSVLSSPCRRVGLMTEGEDLEYTFWWLLRAPQGMMRVEHVRPHGNLEGDVISGYPTCAIICTHCGDEQERIGLPLYVDGGHIQLFMNAP